jgi:iron(III) transport system substrate-binding protein
MGPSFKQASILATTLFILTANAAHAAGEVNVYSNRPAELIQPLLDTFTKQTGIETNLLYLDQGLVERIQSEGEYSPADVILTVDDSRLSEAKQGGVTQALTDARLDAEIPVRYRDTEGHWFGLTLRPRVFYVSAAVTAKAITYEELSQPEWKGKVCLRDGRHASNIGLFASMLDLHGETYTEKWLTGLKANLARKPRGNDGSQVEAVASGECALAIGNTEYLAAMIAEPASKDVAGKVKVIFPNAAERGTSVGISGMAMAKFAPNHDNAVALMEFLAAKPAQELYSQETNEYPVLPGAKPSKILGGFGPWKAEDVAMSQVSRLRKQALDLVEKIQFNDGPAN